MSVTARQPALVQPFNNQHYSSIHEPIGTWLGNISLAGDASGGVISVFIDVGSGATGSLGQDIYFDVCLAGIALASTLGGTGYVNLIPLSSEYVPNGAGFSVTHIITAFYATWPSISFQQGFPQPLFQGWKFACGKAAKDNIFGGISAVLDNGASQAIVFKACGYLYDMSGRLLKQGGQVLTVK